MRPKATRAELWDTGPSKKFGENFVLLSPSDATTPPGSELYLKYGNHSNATLFSEYGFVNHVNTEGKYDENPQGEVELEKVIEDLFEQRGTLGTWMKQVLVEEGYWGYVLSIFTLKSSSSIFTSPLTVCQRLDATCFTRASTSIISINHDSAVISNPPHVC